MGGSSKNQRFNKAAGDISRPEKNKLPAPFSIRFTHDERKQLNRDAGKLSLSAYIRQKLLGDTVKKRKSQYMRKSRQPKPDYAELARMLGQLDRAMQERGYYMARGDRRGSIVAVDIHGEVYSIPRQIGIKVKQVRARIGEEDDLPSVTQARHKIAHDMLPIIMRFKENLHTQETTQKAEFTRKRDELVTKLRADRQNFMMGIVQRRMFGQWKLAARENFRQQRREIKNDQSQFKAMQNDDFETRREAFKEQRRQEKKEVQNRPRPPYQRPEPER